MGLMFNAVLVLHLKHAELSGFAGQALVQLLKDNGWTVAVFAHLC